MKYFYIITFDGQIFEIKHTDEKLASSLRAWQNGELLVLKELGGGIHASSISKILNEELYDSYTYSSSPKLFIKDGVWYDGKERKFVRYEKWKQNELDSIKKLGEQQYEKIDKEKVKDLYKKYRPDFMVKKLSDKLKI